MRHQEIHAIQKLPYSSSFAVQKLRLNIMADLLLTMYYNIQVHTYFKLKATYCSLDLVHLIPSWQIWQKLNVALPKQSIYQLKPV